jgi:benzoyl-CoA reductase/2-hydroxyglutaryl-CoA dehydratase subunit BcrC/BadD/HgdB
MMNAFRESSTTLCNQHVRDWKTGGGSVVGYTCSYVPDEIFSAAGILPYRLRGIGAKEMNIGDAYFGPFICSFPKCLLQLAGEGKYDFLDGVIVTPGCDSMRRLDDCWRKAGEDKAETLPSFFFHYAVPHKTADYSLKWFIEETQRLKAAVEKHFSITITDNQIHEAIDTYNEGRLLLSRLDALRCATDVAISGADALAVVLASTTIPRKAFNSLLTDLIAQIECSSDRIRGRKRLMLVGSANDDVELVRLIEGTEAVVVADNLCFGARFYADLVEQDDDPVAALAKRYLFHNDCPRMFGDYKGRLSILKEKIKRAAVDGVILQNIRFCDLHGSENGIFERDLEAIGIPCIRIEREYGPLVETGRIRMRIDAFLERLDK